MKRGSRRRLVVSAIGLSIVAVGIIGGHLYTNSPNYGLPYSARFTPDAKDTWSALGGTWEVVDGTMRNDSNEHGAKLLTGSPNWKNYTVEGDVQLLGANGSAGILARVTEAEPGENALKGYFAGVHLNMLFLGAYDFAYHEITKVPMPETVRLFRWYHVKLKVDGCVIAASVSAAGMPEVKIAPLTEVDCFHTGNIGLRSNGTGAAWRNITVTPIGSATPAPVTTTLTQAAPPIETYDAPRSLPVQSINSLLYLPSFGSPRASIRGSVVLVRPAVYVEDSTGGVEIQADGQTLLKIGDEVEVTGEVSLEKPNPAIRKARVQVLREGLPLTPTAVPANQLADGYFDGRFIQSGGFLRRISTGKDGGVTLDLDAGTQSFQVILPPGRSRSHLSELALDSRLRVRGISVVDARFNRAGEPFVILAPSVEDVEVVAGPPWWRPSTLIFAIIVGLGLAFAVNHLYFLAKHWRLRAITEERERLAHEIHDTLAQSFAGIGFQLQAIRNSVPRGATSLEAQVDLAMAMARTSHGEARRSIASLRPESLGNTGLVPALRECAERMTRNGNVTVETHGDDGARAVPPRIKDTFYRIGQEAIANSIRHADPSTIRIRLQRTGASVCLSVEDDGKGFIANGDHPGFGLLGMRKRAQSISAAFQVSSTPGFGTCVEVKAAAGSRFMPGIWLRPQPSVKDI